MCIYEPSSPCIKELTGLCVGNTWHIGRQVGRERESLWDKQRPIWMSQCVCEMEGNIRAEEISLSDRESGRGEKELEQVQVCKKRGKRVLGKVHAWVTV